MDSGVIGAGANVYDNICCRDRNFASPPLPFPLMSGRVYVFEPPFVSSHSQGNKRCADTAECSRQHVGVHSHGLRSSTRRKARMCTGAGP
eukprot:6211280-Pleurochrysis_carterae.AAC.1